MSGSGISWARCKSTPSSRPTTTPVSRHSLFYRPDALPAAQPQRQSTEGICLQCFWGIIVLLNFAAYNKLLNNGFTYRTLIGSYALPDRLHYQSAALMTRGALHLFLLPECTVCFTKDMWAEELHYNNLFNSHRDSGYLVTLVDLFHGHVACLVLDVVPVFCFACMRVLL